MLTKGYLETKKVESRKIIFLTIQNDHLKNFFNINLFILIGG